MGECKGTVAPFASSGGNSQGADNFGNLRPNAYGPGIYQNQYGQPVTVQPQGGAVQGERLLIRPNAFGPGVHMDQYGRPVRERTWP